MANAARPARPVAGGLLALLVIGWALGELAKSTATSSDLDAVRDLASERTSLLTGAAHALAFIGSGYVVYGLTLILAVVFYGRGWPEAAVALAVSTVGAAVLANVDKLLVGRARPPVEHLEHVVSESFPSGHSTQASAFYGALLLIFLARRPPGWAAAGAVVALTALVAAIALSRVYLGVHYPSDTIGGVLLGAGWSLLVCRLMLRRGIRPVSGTS